MAVKEQGTDRQDQRWLVSPRTLIFLTHAEEILLIKRGADRRILPAKYNGLGGHLERDEDPLSGALRELEEEAGIRPQQLALKAIYHIDPGTALGVIVFIVWGEVQHREWRRKHSPEGELCWLPIARLSECDLVADLPILLERILPEDSPSVAPQFAHLGYDASGRLGMSFFGEEKVWLDVP